MGINFAGEYLATNLRWLLLIWQPTQPFSAPEFVSLANR